MAGESMGEARRRSVNGNGLLVPDTRLVSAGGVPLSGATASQAAAAKQYGLMIVENGVVLKQGAIADPFIRVKVAPSGWRTAWRVLRGRYTLEVQVHGTEQAMRDVYGPAVLIRP